MLPSLEKFAAMLSASVCAADCSTPRRDHVPLERYGASPRRGAASTALAVSCVAHSTARICPPTSAATEGISAPTAVQGCTIFFSNRRAGSPSAETISPSKACVRAFTNPVDVAFVYSHVFTPVSL